MNENEILDIYKEKIILKVQNYISKLKNTQSEFPIKLTQQMAYYSAELNNTSDEIIEEIFNDNDIDLRTLLKENHSLAYDYSIIIRKSWVIKVEVSKIFDNYCEDILKSTLNSKNPTFE